MVYGAAEFRMPCRYSTCGSNPNEVCSRSAMMKPSSSLELEKYSVGVGDRFAHQAEAQLAACILAGQAGMRVIPVWNKSQREHLTIGSDPATTQAAADAAV